MKMLRLGAVLGLAVAVAACPPRDDVALEDPTLQEEPVAEMAPEAPAIAETANLEAVAGSGVTGEVRALPRDGSTEITLLVQNAPPNESLGARVHSGTCESPGVELARLDAISTDQAGQGQSQTNVGHAAHQILDGNHIAAVFAPGADPQRDQPIACAVLPETAMATQPGTTGM